MQIDYWRLVIAGQVLVISFLVALFLVAEDPLTRHLRERLRRASRPREVDSREVTGRRRPHWLGDTVQRLWGATGRSLVRLLPEGLRQRLARPLLAAGRPFDVSHLFVLEVGCGLLGVVACLAIIQQLRPVSGEWGPAAWLAMASFAAAGLMAPRLWLWHVAARRRQEMRRYLPEVVDLLCVSVRAGLSFNAALSRVAQRLSGPLRDELATCVREIRLGSSRADALRALAARTGLTELGPLAASLAQAERLGVGVGDLLEVYASDLRARRKQRAEEAAMKVPVKMLFPLVFFILPALFVVVLAPAAMMFLQTVVR